MSKQHLPLVDDAGCRVPLVAEPLTAAQAESLAPAFKALGDPVRLRLLSLIASHEGGELCVCDLTDAFDLKAPTISHHLKVLKATGLVTAERRRGRVWYEDRFLPKIGPFALYGLLFTIVVLFALQGEAIIARPWDVVRIAVPLLVYFGLMWAGSLALGKGIGLGYERSPTLAFTAAGNNFELAIAVAIATFGAASGQALAGVVGPLIEVPVLVGLVYVSLWARRFFPALELRAAKS
ncbi:metalloregulator ArsR/SmtB family transcription factor [Glycomyces arizonensis]|uniref:metalloregulator ArsR/SmtB family transcription factor n=1 Tax=Glycomyces arizonensis TaxID=256035 RepID=UPI00040E6590|nr:metalloregulator ArsR/SmtB family transcription factor [Glycomyces arizonensis]